ncbi:DNA-processing protein DprA [Microbacterium oleivorans]|uniref:DNA-processing protein DprA n=1 Tax=Microbacterium oleivorans TaxID=273677 RepID=UPI00203E1937|nr:DNA-processing protein DprA [Microbacterium oleivorans]MCM3696812.1 DNA-processing protein DprA [Microbacterium oleivorans]
MLTVGVARQRERLAGLVPDDVLSDADSLAVHHAHAVWSCLTEPGDGVAGSLIAELGPVHALEVARGAGGSTSAALEAGRRRWQARADTIDDAVDRARRVQARLIVPGTSEWPSTVDGLGVHGPRAIWTRGDLDALGGGRPAVALVGARASTSYGEHVTADLATQLARTGVTIVSGGAYGIDGIAHRASLSAGGVTVAVLAGGVDRAYPAGHAELLARIAQGPGVVVAEVPCGTAPTKWRFLQRNRLIAALSGATVVVEAGWRSGSLNTAGHAAALGRPLGAVPGPVTCAASAGCHRLLREYDARCVTSADEVRELLGGEGPDYRSTSDRVDDTTRILDALSPRSPRSADDVARRAGFAPAEARGMLALLELEGRAYRGPDGWRRGSTAR